MPKRHLLVTLLALVTSPVFAQSDVPLFIGLPWEMVRIEASGFASVDTYGATLLLTVQPDVLPIIAEYANLAPENGLSVMICGIEFPNFQPTPRVAFGEIEIPLHDIRTANSAAAVVAGQIPCAEFAPTQPPEPPIGSLLPPPTGPVPRAGLTLTSPSDSYDVLANDILTAGIVFNDRSGRHDLNLTFGRATTQWIATNTTAHVGEMLQLLVCDEVVNEPIIQAPIYGGSIILAGPASKADAEVEMAQILGQASCP